MTLGANVRKKSNTYTRRSSKPQILYQNREKFHFMHIPKTDSKLIKQKWLNVEAAMNGLLSLDTYIFIFVLVFNLPVWKQNIFFYILFCILYVLKFICI